MNSFKDNVTNKEGILVVDNKEINENVFLPIEVEKYLNVNKYNIITLNCYSLHLNGEMSMK